MTWDDVEFDISPATDMIQILETKEKEEACKEQKEFLFISPFFFEMDKKKKAVRKCIALGGKMDVFLDENELKDLRPKEDCIKI